MKRLEIKIKGTRPMLLHNGQTADPLNKFSKELKKISGKRTKTEEDHLRMSEIEFRAGLYWRDDIGVHMPADNLQAMFLAAAKKTRQGPKCNAIMIDDDMAIRFKNSTNLKKLERDESLYFRKACRVQTQKVMRTRPMVPAGWEGTIVLDIDEEDIDVEDIEAFAHTAGKRIGMGDWRPQKNGAFGKFEVVSINEA